MNKLPTDPRLPMVANDLTKPLTQRLTELFRSIAIAHNDSYYWETSGTAPPTAGSWATGDKCRNTAPAELGTAGSKYIVTGWIRVAGAWQEMRTLTGN